MSRCDITLKTFLRLRAARQGNVKGDRDQGAYDNQQYGDYDGDLQVSVLLQVHISSVSFHSNKNAKAAAPQQNDTASTLSFFR